MGAPAAHLEALRRFPFDTVITPFNYRLAREAAYLRDFDALAAEIEAQDVGLMVIKAVARNLWTLGRSIGTRPGTSRWTRRSTSTPRLRSRSPVPKSPASAPPATCTCSRCSSRPSDADSITVPRPRRAMAGVPEFEPPFVRVPGREVPDWLESLMPES